jgi:alkylation response protein AidB-like acyl-CoA dehydrogenase
MITSGQMPSGQDEARPLSVLSEDERLLQDSVRAFATAVVRPMVRAMDRDAGIPRRLIDQLFALGVMALEAPEDRGGAGGRFFHATLVVEELSRVDPSVGLLVDVQNTLVVNALLRWGTPDQIARWIPSLASSTIGAYALSEAASGSDAFALQLRATADRDGYRLHGHKLWITNAAEADLFIVFATVDPGRGYKGITAFVVERDTPGFSIGRKEDKLGIRASSTCELAFDACRIPASHVVGEVGRGYRIAIETLDAGRIGIGAQMVGLAAGALDEAIRHVRERRQFGQPVADFQGVRFQIARAAMEIQAARLLVYEAARLRDAGLPFITQAAMAKLFASEVAERAASLAVNLCGGAGFVRDHPVEKFYRDAKIGQIYEGTSNMQLVTIAKQILGQ